MNRLFFFCRKYRGFSAATFFLLVLLLLALFADYLAPNDPLAAAMDQSFQPPSRQHLFGTDRLGRDVLSRVIAASRYSLGSTLLMVLIIFTIGTGLGLIAGYFGGWIDALIMRSADLMISFPGLVLAIAVAGILGPSLTNAVLAITAVSWSKYARLARSLVLQINDEPFIQAAVITGTSNRKIVFKYLIPNILPMMIVTASADVGSLMMEIAALSFLGFGAQAPLPEWGAMLNEGRSNLVNAPWIMIFPGISIVCCVAVFNIFGDELSNLMDPKKKT